MKSRERPLMDPPGALVHDTSEVSAIRMQLANLLAVGALRAARAAGAGGRAGPVPCNDGDGHTVDNVGGRGIEAAAVASVGTPTPELCPFPGVSR